MEKENSGSFEYMGRSFSELSVNDDSSAFSDCNSDRSGEFQTASSQNRRLLLACTAENSDDLIMLINLLATGAFRGKKDAATALYSLCSVKSQRQKEIAVSILLQICEDNLVFRAMVTREGAIPPLVALTQSGTNRAKQKAETLIDLLRQPRSGNAAVGRTSDVSG
ncbi:hypothetical protein OIU77_009793 [Salix suchowensis]|uniref:Uncharacterized protein n=1 Tax=Salix suchowensis TaxID=1278906 RepID=A0ABQ9A6P8_9ROSI|nr:hypothetical protein OIU77_009793 [Salix suchowensis]